MEGTKRYTRAFKLTVLELLQYGTIKDVASYLNVGWDLVKEIHKQKLKVTYRNQSFKDLVHLGIDEFSIRKGHKYMTIFMNLQNGRILHAIEGRAADSVAPFMKVLRRKAKNLRAVAVDMSQSYVKAIQEHLGHVDIVFDRYHIAALANTAIDELRRQIQADLDEQDRRYLKGSKYHFQKNYSNLTEEGKAKLQSLLDVNKPLFFMYNMKVLLRYFWMFKTPERAREFLYSWCQDAMVC